MPGRPPPHLDVSTVTPGPNRGFAFLWIDRDLIEGHPSCRRAVTPVRPARDLAYLAQTRRGRSSANGSKLCFVTEMSAELSCRRLTLGPLFRQLSGGQANRRLGVRILSAPTGQACHCQWGNW
jgi:hypothetical protein